jgi:hypothetical protein
VSWARRSDDKKKKKKKKKKGRSFTGWATQKKQKLLFLKI